MAKKWPRKLIGVKLDDGTIIVSETPEEIGDDFADESVGVYELIAVGKFKVEKSVDAKLVKKIAVGRSSR